MPGLRGSTQVLCVLQTQEFLFESCHSLGFQARQEAPAGHRKLCLRHRRQPGVAALHQWAARVGSPRQPNLKTNPQRPVLDASRECVVPSLQPQAPGLAQAGQRSAPPHPAVTAPPFGQIALGEHHSMWTAKASAPAPKNLKAPLQCPEKAAATSGVVMFVLNPGSVANKGAHNFHCHCAQARLECPGEICGCIQGDAPAGTTSRHLCGGRGSPAGQAHWQACSWSSLELTAAWSSG